ALRESGEPGLTFRIIGGEIHEHADAPHPLALLRARRERPCGRAADQRDELPASHSRPQGSKPRTASSHSRPGLGTGRGGCELRQIVRGWERRVWVPRRVKTEKKLRRSRCFPVAPRRRTSLPILETTPAANSWRNAAIAASRVG